MCEYLQTTIWKSLSVHLFAILGVVVVVGDVGEPHILQLCAGIPLVACLSFHVEADHQLVDHHANDGAKERSKDRHQEPTVSRPNGSETGKSLKKSSDWIVHIRYQHGLTCL